MGVAAEAAAQVVVDLADTRTGVCLAKLRQRRVILFPFAVPLVGETARDDVVHELAHGRRHVEVVEAAPPGELTVLAGR
ncbi:MAG: hypothetical protein EDR02_05625 [Actinobacteria bacterium]|nr:MAG: hypothetical protein EDR02_05625 [Actinomycetota bacterium]RIK08128.1 MAG: hypothetical protein DCC48_01745 [Acidobacteriota bacterium]